MNVGGWIPASVADASNLTQSARMLLLEVPGWPGNLPGQHLDLRLTAEDGYQAVRSYSIASSGAGELVEIAVDEIPEGEVSPYLTHDVRPGDELEVKGPLGGYFVWRADDTSRVQLIAGGSGIVPLLAMARARIASGIGGSFRLLYSVRSAEDALYRDEIDELVAGGLEVTWAYTRRAPESWPGSVGRLTASTISATTWSTDLDPLMFVCGPTGFVESVADTLVALGHDPARVKTERFGG